MDGLLGKVKELVSDEQVEQFSEKAKQEVGEVIDNLAGSIFGKKDEDKPETEQKPDAAAAAPAKPAAPAKQEEKPAAPAKDDKEEEKPAAPAKQEQKPAAPAKQEEKPAAPAPAKKAAADDDK